MIIKKLLLIMLIFILILGCTACNQNQPMVKTDNPVKIGAILPLTGGLAKSSEEFMGGLEKAVKDNPNFKLLVEDCAGNSEQAINVANKLIEVDKVSALIVPFSHLVSPVAQFVKDKNVILFYYTVLPDMALENKFIFKDYFSADKEGEILAQAATQEQDQSVAILHVEADFSSEAIHSFENSFKGKISKFSFTMQETDFKTLLLKIKQQNVESILIYAYPVSARLILKQMAELEMKNKVYGMGTLYPEVLDDPQALSILKTNNAILMDYSSDFVIDQSNSKVMELVDYFNKSYNRQPSVNTYYVYDDLMVMAIALKRCNNLWEPECIIKQIHLNNFQGLNQEIKFDEYGIAQREQNLIQFDSHGINPYKIN